MSETKFIVDDTIIDESNYVSTRSWQNVFAYSPTKEFAWWAIENKIEYRFEETWLSERQERWIIIPDPAHAVLFRLRWTDGIQAVQTT